MNPSRRFGLILGFLGMAGHGWAEPPAVIKELIVQMRAELQADMKNARENDRGGERQWQVSAMLLQIERAFDDDGSGPDYELSQSIGVLQSYAGSEKAQQIAQALASEANKELAKRENAAATELDKLIEKHAKTALDASTAAELDAAVAELTKAQRQSQFRGGSRRGQGNYERLQQATQFITQWQDYLAAKEAGRLDQARSALSNLSSYGREYSFIPRSKLLALINSLTPERSSSSSREPVKVSLTDFLAGIKTLDELVAAKERLSPSNFQGGESSTVVFALRSMADSYAAIKAGQATSLRMSMSESLTSAETTRLRELFLTFALPRILQLDEEKEGLQPGEKVVTYLTRTLAGAQKKQDWALVNRIVTTSRSLNLLDSVTSSSDSSALTQFLAGLNQEKAKQYSLAVASFQAALKTGSQIVSPELIGEHLEVIRAQYPTEFEKGVQIALIPPQPAADPRYISPAGIPYGVSTRPPWVESRMPTSPEVTVAVPAKPTPEPKPAPTPAAAPKPQE